MKAIKTLLAVALAAAGLAATADVQAQAKHGWSGRGHGHYGGRHWHGGHRWHGPSFGFYIGAPLLLGSYYWNDPWYWDRPAVVYREVIREPEGFETEREPEAAPADVPGGEGAPAQGPLYMNYCASAKAYFPKVTKCPEGWKFISPTQ